MAGRALRLRRGSPRVSGTKKGRRRSAQQSFFLYTPLDSQRQGAHLFFLRIGRELTWFAFLSGSPYTTVRHDAEGRVVSPKVKKQKCFFNRSRAEQAILMFLHEFYDMHCIWTDTYPFSCSQKILDMHGRMHYIHLRPSNVRRMRGDDYFQDKI